MAGYDEPLWPLVLTITAWAGVLHARLRGEGPGLSPAHTGLLWLLPVVSAAGWFFSANRGATLLQLVVLSGMGATAWLAAFLAGRNAWVRSAAALLAGAFLCAAFALQEYLIHLRAGDPAWRAFGQPPGALFPLGFTNGNFLAGYLAPALVLALGVAFHRPAAFRGALWALTAALVSGTLGGALLVTGSRGGLLAAAGGIAVLVVSAAMRRGTVAPEGWLRLGLCILVVGGVAAGLSGSLRARQVATTGTALPAELCPGEPASAAGESARFRLLTWEGAAEMGTRRPLVGWGLGSFETTYAGHARAGYTRHAHSGYLQLFAETGFPGVAAWLLLGGAALLAALRCALRATAGQVRQVAPALGALVATAAHNVFDSTWYVPAVGLLTYALVGTLLAVGTNPGGVVSARASLGARVGTVLAAVLLALATLQAVGRALLIAGRTELRTRPAAAPKTLALAAALLPGDHRVAVSQLDAAMANGDIRAAEEAARRVVRAAPEWSPGYYRLAMLFRYQGNTSRALTQLRIGLEHAPQEVKLLYATARLLDELGERAAAMEVYERLTRVEESPVGQVRALGEVRDYRFARARMALARREEAAGRMDTALEHLRAAACLLAQRRLLHDGNPAAYIATGDGDPETERELRGEEERLWMRLRALYRTRGDSRLAELCGDQAVAVSASFDRLESILRESYPRGQ